MCIYYITNQTEYFILKYFNPKHKLLLCPKEKYMN